MASNHLTKHTYSKKDFIYNTNWDNKSGTSDFDKIVQSLWKSKLDEGLFRYKINVQDWKILPGKYHFFAQLNLDRAENRRTPQEVNSINQPFSAQQFNFTKMNKKEIIFELVNEERKVNGNFLAINVSPIEFGHCLYLPAMNSCLVQIPTMDSLCEAIEILLLSNTPSFRVGFNGLCAYCSLNHLHFHSYYLDRQMHLETVEVEHLSGPCYTLTSFPSKGFVFQLGPDEDPKETSRNVYKLTNFLQENEEPYNIYITRSVPIGQKFDDGKRNHVRVYVWARTPTFGMKNLTIFHPALCELFGHLAVKTKDGFESMTEESVAAILSHLTTEPFNRVLQKVKLLFTK